MRDLYRVFTYTRYKVDYIARAGQLGKNITLFEEDLQELVEDSQRLMKSYSVDAEIRREKDGKSFRAIWVFPKIRVSCKSIKHTYSLKVRDFGRVSEDHRSKISTMFTHDKVFAREVNRLEVRRNLINNGVKANQKIINMVNELYKEKRPLGRYIDVDPS